MNELTDNEKKLLFRFAEQNQDAGWDYLAQWATQTFNKKVTGEWVARFYMTALIG